MEADSNNRLIARSIGDGPFQNDGMQFARE